MSELRISGIVGREDVVDGQRMKYAPGALKAIAREIPDTLLMYCFNLADPPVGIVEAARMMGPNLEVTAMVYEAWVKFIKSRNLALRPGFSYDGCHKEGSVFVIEKIHTMWISLVPEEYTFAIDAEAEVRGALLLKQMEDAKDE